MRISLLFMYMDNNTERAQQQQQQQQLTNQSSPIAIIPGLTQNVLTIVSFLIGTSSFILGLRIQRCKVQSDLDLNFNPNLALFHGFRW
jgi:hypothetical protein